eukprot:1145048-Pelagomonas_calceolata.AAC.1
MPDSRNVCVPQETEIARRVACNFHSSTGSTMEGRKIDLYQMIAWCKACLSYDSQLVPSVDYREEPRL